MSRRAGTGSPRPLAGIRLDLVTRPEKIVNTGRAAGAPSDFIPGRATIPTATEGRHLTVYLLILDSLGSTELFFILIMALIFFGPRKLPQISRSLGKSLAEFRKASEDFKRTWEREVALESTALEEKDIGRSALETDSIWGAQARQSPVVDPSQSHGVSADGEFKNISGGEESVAVPDETSNKRTWL
ncbi:MAG TPA: twin-arginine translocase TatA/TatE family subunit [Pyrinomonadaceae bacterium]|nr:twin-arginine translocase TatA/TatE family subunit [Pyrinomonadaceae bacterium]